MLKRRIATAIALIVPLLAALYLLPSAWIVALFGLIVFPSAREWAALCGFSERARGVYAAALTVTGATLAFGALRWPVIVWVLSAAAALWWFWALIELARPSGLYHAPRLKAASGFLVLISMWVGAVYLHAADPRSPAALLYVLALVWIADSAAYLAGSAFGRTKLAPGISPGKTFEGLGAAIAAVVLLAFFCGTMVWRLEGRWLGIWIAFAVAVTLVSVLGDLSESKLKRVAGVKDSGTLLPGHGGVLDRIDALTSAIPVYTLGWLVLRHAPI